MDNKLKYELTREKVTMSKKFLMIFKKSSFHAFVETKFYNQFYLKKS